jgi:hypothetical protein
MTAATRILNGKTLCTEDEPTRMSAETLCGCAQRHCREQKTLCKSVETLDMSAKRHGE